MRRLVIHTYTGAGAGPGSFVLILDCNFFLSQTIFLKSIVFKKSKNFERIFFFTKKMLFSYFGQLRRLVFDHSSPVHPISDFRGVALALQSRKSGNPRV